MEWRSGAGEKKNLYMKNDDVDRQTDVVVVVKEEVGEEKLVHGEGASGGLFVRVVP